MGPLLLLDLAYAAGVALSPTPVVVVILMLFAESTTRSTRRNALAFLTGWVIGIGFLGLTLYWLAVGGVILADQASDYGRPVLSLSVGIGLVYLARKQWEHAPKADEVPEMPKWLGRVDELITRSGNAFTPARAMVLAIVMSALSPKNIVLVLAITLAIVQSELIPAAQFFLLLVFTILSSITIGIPVMYALYKGDQAEARLREWKDWMLQNTRRMAAVFLGILGVILVAKSLADLVSIALTN